MGDAGWNHDDITGAQLHRPARLAAESHADPTGGNGKHLMRAAVIVVMRVAGVLPCAGPAIALEQGRTARRGIVAPFSSTPRQTINGSRGRSARPVGSAIAAPVVPHNMMNSHPKWLPVRSKSREYGLIDGPISTHWTSVILDPTDTDRL